MPETATVTEKTPQFYMYTITVVRPDKMGKNIGFATIPAHTPLEYAARMFHANPQKPEDIPPGSVVLCMEAVFGFPTKRSKKKVYMHDEVKRTFTIEEVLTELARLYPPK